MKKLFLTFCLLAIAGMAFADDSGTCGNNLQWSYNNATHELTITGSGAMRNWSSQSSVPWSSYRSEITSVSLPNGLTSIGDYAFCGCTDLTSVTIPNSVTSIGEYAFFNCPGLREIYLYSTTPPSLSENAFPNSDELIIYVPFGTLNDYSVTEWGNYNLQTYMIVANADDESHGSVNITENYVGPSVFVVTVEAIPNYGYHFTQWSDGTTTNPRTETQPMIIQAEFEPNQYNLTLDNNSENGVINGESGNFDYLTEHTIEAVANSEYQFWEWSDGVSENPRTIILTQDTVLSAVFERNMGHCGNDNALTWIYDPETFTLTISGEGQLNANYTFGVEAPNNMQHLVVEDGVTSVGRYAFNRYTSLTSIEIGSGVTSIGELAFEGCTGLMNITIGNNVKSLGKGVFSGCIGLINLVIPEGVTDIGEGAFAFCTNLSSVSFPLSLVNIGLEAFVGCYALTEVIIPENVQKCEVEAFLGCDNLSHVVWEAKNCNYVSYDTPAVYHYFTPFAARTYDCDRLSNISNFEFGENVERIPNCLCAGIIGITNISIPNSVTSIGEDAFYGCTDLTSVTIPNSVTSIGRDAFRDCRSLTSVTMLSEIPLTRGADAFPSGVVYYVPCGTLSQYQSAGYYSAQYQELNYALTANATQHALVNYIPYNQCEQTTQITVVPDYGYEFVQWNDGNTDNPRNVTMIGDLTLTAEIVIMRSGHCGNDNALTWTYNPETFTLIISGEGQLNDNYTYGVESPSEMLNLIIEDGVTSIGNNAFHNNTSMTSVIIPNSVTSIEEEAFSGCTGLTSVSIGENVRTIGNNAFKDCIGLENLYCYRTLPPNAYSTAFDGVDKFACVLHVPSESIDYYKNAAAWRDFFYVTILGAETTEVTALTITPHEDNADVMWPAVVNAYSYEFTITDSNGNTVCTLTFNANGQLTGLILHAPAAEGVMQRAAVGTGFSFNVTGLENGSSYNLVIKAKDSNGTVLQTFSQDFTTGATALENVSADGASGVRKVIEDGKVIIIMPDGRKFDASGRKLR